MDLIELVFHVLALIGLLGMGVGMWVFRSADAPRPAWRGIFAFRPIWKQRDDFSPTGWRLYTMGIAILAVGVAGQIAITVAQ